MLVEEIGSLYRTRSDFSLSPLLHPPLQGGLHTLWYENKRRNCCLRGEKKSKKKKKGVVYITKGW